MSSETFTDEQRKAIEQIEKLLNLAGNAGTAAEASAAKTLNRLAKRGMFLTGLQALPDMSSPMPYANAARGYIFNDKGTCRVLTFAQVMEAAK